jgi:ribosomal protein L29
MKIAELRKLDTKGLLSALEKAQAEAFKHKFEVSTGQSKNIHQIHSYKKQVAQIKTLLKESGEAEVKVEEPKKEDKA